MVKPRLAQDTNVNINILSVLSSSHMYYCVKARSKYLCPKNITGDMVTYIQNSL